jgi:ERCC4-type nuclease
MVIVIDTRQQKNKHKIKEDYFKTNGVKFVRSKLFVGDYSRLDNMSVCIDTKKDVCELASNICGKQHERFRNECLKAKENGIKLIILIEEVVENLNNWVSPLKKNGEFLTIVKGETLKKCIETMEIKYGVKFLFCSKLIAPKVILRLLNTSGELC